MTLGCGDDKGGSMMRPAEMTVAGATGEAGIGGAGAGTGSGSGSLAGIGGGTEATAGMSGGIGMAGVTGSAGGETAGAGGAVAAGAGGEGGASAGAGGAGGSGGAGGLGGGGAGGDGGGLPCAGDTPHGCYAAQSGNHPMCPPNTPEQSAFYPPAEEWNGCNGIEPAAPFGGDPEASCSYAGPAGEIATCLCDTGLHWLCTYPQ